MEKYTLQRPPSRAYMQKRYQYSCIIIVYMIVHVYQICKCIKASILLHTRGCQLNLSLCVHSCLESAWTECTALPCIGGQCYCSCELGKTGAQCNRGVSNLLFGAGLLPFALLASMAHYPFHILARQPPAPPPKKKIVKF